MARALRCTPVLLACLLAACGPGGGGASEPAPIPTPIGVGPLFRPPAANPTVLAGKPVDGRPCEGTVKRFGVHIELFARGRVVIVPPGIGVARPFDRRGAYVYPHGCTYPIRTLEPTGVLEVDAGLEASLETFFRIWGQPLSPRGFAGFRAPRPGKPVRAYVDGVYWHGDLREIPLDPHAQIVLEIGPRIEPHRTFAFRPGL